MAEAAESTLVYAEPVLLYPEASKERPRDINHIRTLQKFCAQDHTDTSSKANDDGAVKHSRARGSLLVTYPSKHPLSRATRSPSPIRVQAPRRPKSQQRQGLTSRQRQSKFRNFRNGAPSSNIQANMDENVARLYLSKHQETRHADVGSTSRTGRILEKLLPSRKWARDDPSLGLNSNFSEAGLDSKPHFVQRVSTVPPSRAELETMMEKFDARLKKLSARPHLGNICPIRQKLYSELFDEVIRQVTLEMPERGMLLVRIRDELRLRIMTMLAIQDYASGFGTIYGKEEEFIESLERKCNTLKFAVTQLRAQKSTMQHCLRSVTAEEMLETERESMLREDELQTLHRQRLILREGIQKVERLQKSRSNKEKNQRR